MHILVTGAAGDFGRDLAPWLARSHDVVCSDARPLETALPFRQADLTDAGQVAGLCEGCEAVIHLAALLPKDQYSTTAYLSANVQAVCLLAEEALRAGVKRFIYVSTVWATGHGAEEGRFRIDEQAPARPVCMYGVSKYLGETMVEYYAHNHGLSSLVLRACGYLRHPAVDDRGEIDWEQADLGSLAARLTSPAAKLYHPGDLGPLFEQALGLPDPVFRRVLIGLTPPFGEEEAELCRRDPVAAWERRYPGAAEFLDAVGHQPPAYTHAYDNSLSRELLGFRMSYDLGDLISAWRQREGSR